MQVIRLNNAGRKFHGNKGVAEASGSEWFWALRNIYLSVDQGQIVGILGRNGSGKSTLLNVLAGVLPVSEGEAKVNGKVSAILTLGAGFQDEFSGKENVYLNASILGMDRQEIDRKFNDILEFSELGNFINAPVSTYSSGMKLRLAFAIAIHRDFDILLADEIIAVGDEYFQKKCFEKMAEFKRQKKSIVIASQDISLIERFCETAFLLEDGKLISSGPAAEVAENCRLLISKKKVLSERLNSTMVSQTQRWATDMNEWGKREGTKEAIIKDITVLDRRRQPTNQIRQGEKITVRVDFVANSDIDDFHFGIALFREDGVYCYGTNTRLDGLALDKMGSGEGFFELVYDEFPFMQGIYFLSAAIWDKNEKYAYDYLRCNRKIEIIGPEAFGQLLYLPNTWTGSYGDIQAQYHPDLDLLIDKAATSGNNGQASFEQLSFFNNYGNKDNVFISGRDLKIKVDFKINNHQEHKDLILWIGLYRSDNIYCSASFKKISARNLVSEILTYSKLKLLPGGYKISAGIWDPKNRLFLAYSHCLHQFNIISEKRDHGTVYLSHNWHYEIPKGDFKCEPATRLSA